MKKSSQIKKLQDEINQLKLKNNNKFQFFSEQDLLKAKQWEKAQNPPNRFSDFKMPESFKITTDAEKMTNDSLPINQFDFAQYGKINKTLVNNWFLGYQEYSLLSQNGIIQNIVQGLSQDCTREWIKITSTSKIKNKDDKIKKIEKEFRRLKVRKTIKLAMELTFLMGGCKIYPKIKGDDSTEGGDTLSLPFYKEQMKKGELLYLKVIEPLWANPLTFNASNPLLEDYYEPSLWNVVGKNVHESRLLHFKYNYVPTLLKPVYWFYGVPLVQLCLDYILGFETIRQNVVGISGRYNLNILKTDMNSLGNDYSSTFKEGQSLEDRLKVAQYYMSNFSIFALSNDQTNPEEWQQFNMTIAGLDGLLGQNAELIGAVTRIPAIKLFGQTPKGLNATGEIELKLYYDLCKSLQTDIMQDNLQEIFELVQINLFGEIDDDLEIEFNPLLLMSKKEKEEINVMKKDVYVSYVQTGILTTEEVRQKLNEDPDSGFHGLPAIIEEEDDSLEDIEMDLENEEKETV
jgi:phage-related protein (TIGR01555 family)